MLETPFSVSVPPETLVAAAALNELATVRLPPVTASMSSPRIERLLIVFVPERCVTVCAPATLITTSSAAPGSSGLEPQFVAMSQKLDPPTQLTTAASDGAAAAPARVRAITTSDANPRRWNDLRMAPLLPLAASDPRSRGGGR